jgi:hypothetical protein
LQQQGPGQPVVGQKQPQYIQGAWYIESIMLAISIGWNDNDPIDVDDCLTCLNIYETLLS